MFLRNYWYAAALSGEVGRTLLARRILGEPLVLFRTEAGEPAALADMCPHRQYPLSRGTLTADGIRCGYHGLRFAADGRCVEIPGQPSIPPRARVKAYPVAEKWRWVWVWMGDAEDADEAAIPDMHWNDDPAWAPTGGYLHIECSYQLLVDNLLDLSHAAYVHPGTIGDRSVAETPPAVHTEGEKVVLERQMFGVNAPPFFRTLHGYSDKIDRMHRIEFAPPANIVILSCCVPPGTNDFDSPKAMKYYVLNGITPATDRSVHHFWAVNRNFLLEDEALTKGFQEQSTRTFFEDVDVLEAQQRRIDEADPGFRWLDVNNDQAGVAARRVVASLLKSGAA